MQLSQFEKGKVAIHKLRVLSFEMNIYLVDVELDDYRGLIRDEKGNPMRFHSVTQIKELFSGIEVKEAELVHESPYDEMIGNPPRANNAMVLPIQISSSEVS